MPKKKRKKSARHSGRLTYTIVIILITITVTYYYKNLDFFSEIDYLPQKSLSYQPRLEIPASSKQIKNEQIIPHAGYTISYNPQWKISNWVAYELTADETKGKARRTDKFTPDPLIAGASAENSDYNNSRYDRGHMAPAGDMKWNKSVMKESFYFSNICPQHPHLNRGVWKDLEELIREWAVQDSILLITCGPVVGEKHKTIGKNKVAVPHSFYKVIISPYHGSPKGIGFLFKNTKETAALCSYIVSIDSIEELTGIDFFPLLPDSIENKIEATPNIKEWQWLPQHKIQ